MPDRGQPFIYDRLSMHGRVAVVTGAGRGMGRAIAFGLAEVGCAVVIAERDTDTGPDAENALRAAGHQALWVQTDVRDAASVDAVMRAAVERFGRLDTLVNNAGGTFFLPAVDTSENGFHAIVNTNLTSVWLCSQAAAKAMIAAGRGGSIVSISSMSAYLGAYHHAPYGAAKAGIIGLSHALAVEWAEHGIRVNVVAPGGIATEGSAMLAQRRGADSEQAERQAGMRVPLGRRGTPEEIASAVVFLASDLASYVTGQTLLVDGAATIGVGR